MYTEKKVRGAFWMESLKMCVDGELIVSPAWNFAWTVFWNEQRFLRDQIASIKSYLSHYFEAAGNFKSAFITFCERIIRFDKYRSVRPDELLPQPNVWFNIHYENGFAATRGTLPPGKK